MWEPPRKLLLLLILTSIALSIFSYFLIDWNNFNKNIISAVEELGLTFVFIYFLFQLISTIYKNK